MSHDLFISYVRADHAFAEAARIRLERDGLRCWIDKRDINPSEGFADALAEAIDSSQLLILILTQASIASPWIGREVTQACANGIPILPIRLEDVEPSPGLAFMIGTHSWLEAVGIERDDAIDRLAESVAAALYRGRRTLEHAQFSPPPSRAFLGRREELADLERFLADDSSRALAIEGMGGIGKTCLAAKLASMAKSKGFECFWTDCREDTSLDSVLRSLAQFARLCGDQALGDLLDDVTLEPEKRAAISAAALGSLPAVLFFDDFHLVSDPMISHLLERAVSMKFVIAARCRPAIAKRTSPVLLRELILNAGLDAASCGRLLDECGVSVDQNTAEQIWTLTGQGHPKALEVFAARCRSYPVEELLSSLPVFRTELRDDWLRPLLMEIPEQQRELAVELSVFDRPIPYSVLEWLHPGGSATEAVVGLVDRFVLDSAGGSSLRMHELLREFCYRLLQDPGAAHARAAACYLEKSGSERDPELITDSQLDAGLAAWSHLVRAGDSVRATDQLRRLRGTMMNRGQYQHLMLLIEQTVIPEEYKDWFAIDRARILSLWGQYEAAVESVGPLVDAQDPDVSREAILVLATVYGDRSEHEASLDLLETHQELFGEATGRRTNRRFLHRLIEAYCATGRGEQALLWASKLVEACEAAGDQIGGAIAMRHMARIFKERRELDTALSLCMSSHTFLLDHGRRRDAALTMLLMAEVHHDSGGSASALQCLADASDTFLKIGDLKNGATARRLASEWSREKAVEQPQAPN